MYGIVEGEVELRTSHGVIHTVGPDGTFGEMAVIDSSPRMATAVDMTDTKLAVIDRHLFLFLVHRRRCSPCRSCPPWRNASDRTGELPGGRRPSSPRLAGPQ